VFLSRVSNLDCPTALACLRGKLCGKFNRSNHTRMFRKSFARDVEGSAMIN
jgi:hypothetical protein